MNKETLEFKKEVLRIYKKWIAIWLTIIFTYVLLIIISFCLGWYNITFGFSTGIIFSLFSLKSHQLDIEDQMRDIKKMEVLDKRIEEEKLKIKQLKEELGIKERN